MYKSTASYRNHVEDLASRNESLAHALQCMTSLISEISTILDGLEPHKININDTTLLKCGASPPVSKKRRRVTSSKYEDGQIKKKRGAKNGRKLTNASNDAKKCTNDGQSKQNETFEITIPQSGVRGVSWYGGPNANTYYWVTQWVVDGKQRKRLFTTGKLTVDNPLGILYATSLRKAIKLRREMMVQCGATLRKRPAVDSPPPLETINCFNIPEPLIPQILNSSEWLMCLLVDYLASPILTGSTVISTAPSNNEWVSSTDELLKHFAYYRESTVDGWYQGREVCEQLLSRSILRPIHSGIGDGLLPPYVKLEHHPDASTSAIHNPCIEATHAMPIKHDLIQAGDVDGYPGTQDSNQDPIKSIEWTMHPTT